MTLLSVLVEHPIYRISKTYLYLSHDECKKGIRVRINFNNQHIIGFVMEIEKIYQTPEQLNKKYGYEIKFIDEFIDKESIFDDEMLEVAKIASKRFFYPLIGVLQAMVPTSLKPSSVSKNSFETFYAYNEDANKSIKINKREESLLEFIKSKKLVSKEQVQTKKKTLSHLLEKELIKETKKSKVTYNIEKVFEYDKTIVLNSEQEKVYNDILNSNKIGNLIYGVTGSGKTEIYIKLIEYYLSKGMSALVLVPEIGLTPLMVSRIISYFDSNIVAVMHSSLTKGESYYEYDRIKKGKARIVIGTRSAIFSPIKDLGLICIDEEQDDSYFQEDNFSYNAKDIAFIRAKLRNIKIVLGSATPSIETMAKAKNGMYSLSILNKRFNNKEMPITTVIDMLDRKNFSIKSSIFSLYLIKKIQDALNRKDQIIILINTKGYAKSISCRECGHIFKCPTCNTTLFYHNEDNTLRCHHCNYKIKNSGTCPSCGSTYLAFNGFGIERVEEEFKKIFNVPFLSLDGDRIKKSVQISAILKDFEEQKAQVLIGTQIVSKGHDFKKVSLIGVINADNSFFIPSYKSKENNFILLSQIIGRSGRGNTKGEAVIQTSYKDDYSTVCAINHDYEGFFNKEIIERNKFKYPPFYYLVKIILTSKNPEVLKEKANLIKDFLSNNEEAILLGPTNITKNKNLFRTSILIKIKKLKSIEDDLNGLMDLYKSDNKVNFKIILNPNLIN